MNLRDTIQDWLFKVAFKKAAVAVAGYAAGGILAFLAGPHLGQAQEFLGKFGVSFAVQFDAEDFRRSMETLGVTGFAAAHDFVKLHTGWKWL